MAARHRHAVQAFGRQFGPYGGERVVDVPAVADEDLHPGGTRLPLRQAVHEHGDLAPYVWLVAHRLGGGSVGDRHRFVVPGDRDVEDRSMTRTSAAKMPGHRQWGIRPA